jgi:hypothetical protein
MATRRRSAEEVPSKVVLERAATRAFHFCRGLSKSSRLFTLMCAKGMTPEDLNEGGRLCKTLTDCPPVLPQADGGEAAAAAVVELDSTDEPLFRRARAALRRLHPDQERYVFTDLTAAQGPEAVLRIATFLNRLDDLEGSEDRKDMRKEDRAALATLAQRGIDETERKRLRRLVNVALKAPSLLADDPKAEAREQARIKVLVALYEWLQDWADTARVAFKRREDLITVGLAKRRGPAIVDVDDDEDGEEEEEETPAKPSKPAQPAKAGKSNGEEAPVE